MGENKFNEFASDIVNEAIDNNPTKAKKITRIVIGIACILVVCAFILGKFMMGIENKIDNLTEKVEKNSLDILDTKNNLTGKLENIYDDGYAMFEEYQTYSKKQFELIIDYNNNADKKLLKNLIDYNQEQKKQEVKSNMVQSKQKTYVFDKNAIDINYIVSNNNNKDTIFVVKNAPKDYKIWKKYKIKSKNESKLNNGLIDITYQNY